MTDEARDLLAERVASTPAYSAKELRSWRTPKLEQCDQSGTDSPVETKVFLVNEKYRDLIVAALRAKPAVDVEEIVADIEKALSMPGSNDEFSWGLFESELRQAIARLVSQSCAENQTPD